MMMGVQSYSCVFPNLFYQSLRHGHVGMGVLVVVVVMVCEDFLYQDALVGAMDALARSLS